MQIFLSKDATLGLSLRSLRDFTSIGEVARRLRAIAHSSGKSDISHTRRTTEQLHMNPSRIQSLSSHPGPVKNEPSVLLPIGMGMDYSKIGPVWVPAFSKNSLVDECGGE
jgi:hypothetical protein